MNLVGNSVAILNAGLKATAGVEATYRRDTEAIEQLTLVPTQVRADDYGTDNVLASANEKDWIVWAADLVLAGKRWEPQRGDLIDWTDDDGVKHTYEVLPRGDEGRVYRFTDPSEQQLRVFTIEKPATA